MADHENYDDFCSSLPRAAGHHPYVIWWKQGEYRFARRLHDSSVVEGPYKGDSNPDLWVGIVCAAIAAGFALAYLLPWLRRVL